MDRDLNRGLPDYGLLLIQAGLLLVDLKVLRALNCYPTPLPVSGSNNPYGNFDFRKMTTNALIRPTRFASLTSYSLLIT